MRGHGRQQVSMLTLRTPEQMVPKNHPLRQIKGIVDEILGELSPTLDGMYSAIGRPSVPPERLLKAQLLIALYSVRSDRLFCEQLAYNMLFRWFLDMGLDEEPFNASTFSQNRERLFNHAVGLELLSAVVTHARAKKLMSDEHFSVDGTLIEAWASLKSFRKKDAPPPTEPPDDPGNPTVNFRGEKRTNETHASRTDPEAKLARKSNGTTARLSFSAHALIENRHGLIVGLTVAAATGRAEREEALRMLDNDVSGTRRIPSQQIAATTRRTSWPPAVSGTSRHTSHSIRNTARSTLEPLGTRVMSSANAFANGSKRSGAG